MFSFQTLNDNVPPEPPVLHNAKDEFWGLNKQVSVADSVVAETDGS